MLNHQAHIEVPQELEPRGGLELTDFSAEQIVGQSGMPLDENTSACETRTACAGAGQTGLSQGLERSWLGLVSTYSTTQLPTYLVGSETHSPR